MKTKAYKLAAELGVAERSVLEWLRDHGYPNARRADTIRADVAQAARTALGRERERGERPAPTGRHTTRGGGGPQEQARSAQGFRVSFADLLESHLPQSSGAAVAANPTATTPNLPSHRPAPGATMPPPRRTTGSLSAEQTLRLQLKRIEGEQEQAQRELTILRQTLEAENRRLAEARQALAGLDAARHALSVAKAENEQLLLERATLKQSLQAAADEQATLAQTCVDLQGEVRGLQEGLAAADKEHEAKEAMISDLEQVMQREMAWRTRALELERAANLGSSLHALLQELGLEEVGPQAAVLRALLARPDSAAALIRSIRQVDGPAIQRMVQGRMARVCGHPQCNLMAQNDDRVRVRVAEQDCEVCGGDRDQRWFARLVRECGRAGVRRLLVIGGSAGTQKALRELSQGQPVDLRLVDAEDEVHPARVRGRVEGCDLLVLWSELVVPELVSDAYATAARSEGRPVITVLGATCGVARFARAICNRLARNLILAAV